MEAISSMLEQWRAERVPLNPGATEAQLELLEQMMGVALPADIRVFYAAANGMEDHQRDARMVSMWSIERIRQERNIQDGEDSLGPYQDIAFADALFSAWHFRYRVRPEGPVSLVVDLTQEELPGLAAVFEAMVQRPASLALAAPSRN